MANPQPLPAPLGAIIGGYELVRVLSHGGMGCVYQGVHARLGRVAAVKVLAAHHMADEDLVKRFFREARIVNEVRHPNIVDIFDFVDLESPRRVACVMEYIEGPTLKAVVRRRRMSVVQAVNAMLQLIDALRAVHALGVIHRDLKPTNILVTGNLRGDLSEIPSVKVLDFGIAKIEDATGEHKTASGTMLGTPAYMAPEQVAADTVNTAADIYALGELFYEMVSGRRAFEGSRTDVLKAKVIGAVPPLPMPEGIPSAVEIRRLVTRCVAHAFTERPTLAELEAEVRGLSTEDRGFDVNDAETMPGQPPSAVTHSAISGELAPTLLAPTLPMSAGIAIEIPTRIADTKEVDAIEGTDSSASASMVLRSRSSQAFALAGAILVVAAGIALYELTRPEPSRVAAELGATPATQPPRIQPPPPPSNGAAAVDQAPTVDRIVPPRLAPPSAPVTETKRQVRPKRPRSSQPPPPPPPKKDGVEMPSW
jgi:serine/threonine protein kinase